MDVVERPGRSRRTSTRRRGPSRALVRRYRLSAGGHGRERRIETRQCRIRPTHGASTGGQAGGNGASNTGSRARGAADRRPAAGDRGASVRVPTRCGPSPARRPPRGTLKSKCLTRAQMTGCCSRRHWIWASGSRFRFRSTSSSATSCFMRGEASWWVSSAAGIPSTALSRLRRPRHRGRRMGNVAKEPDAAVTDHLGCSGSIACREWPAVRASGRPSLPDAHRAETSKLEPVEIRLAAARSILVLDDAKIRSPTAPSPSNPQALQYASPDGRAPSSPPIPVTASAQAPGWLPRDREGRGGRGKRSRSSGADADRRR